MTSLHSARPPVRRPLVWASMAAALLLTTTAALAQPGGVRKPDQVTEAGLIEDLAIGPANVQTAPAALPDGVKTRGFGPAPRAQANSPAARQAGQASQAQKSGKSNLMVTFVTNSAQLTPEGIQVLDTVARALQSDSLAGFAFRIEGHADPRGQAELNQTLSELRARAVVDYLVQTRGILAERLVPLGKGATELFDPRRPDAPENRRVTIVTQR